MSEKNKVDLSLMFDADKIERLKATLRNGGQGPMSASQAVYRAVELAEQNVRAVRLDEPERKEIESRTGAGTPLRSSKDILRAFDKVAGGTGAVTIDVDPQVEDLMKDVGRGLGYGLAEFVRIVVEDSFVTNYLHTVELRQLFFSQQEWKMLLQLVKSDRVSSGGALLTLLRKALPPEEKPFRSLTIPVEPAEPSHATTSTGPSK
jgi:hypothetical protein